MKHKILLVGTILSAAILLVLLETTNPTSTGPLGILIVFILMYMSALGVLTYFIMGLSYLVCYIGRALRSEKSLQRVSFLHAYYYASVVSLMPVMFVGMKSVGDLGVAEVLLVIVFVAAACFYIKKRF